MKHRVYIRKGFKSHIEKILCYPFKLKYLNQKVFYPTLKKKLYLSHLALDYLRIFTSIADWRYILMSFKSHIWRKKIIGSRSGLPGSWVDQVLPGCCPGRSFIKPGPVQPLGRPARSGLITRNIVTRTDLSIILPCKLYPSCN
jgi:hypothetical protein